MFDPSTRELSKLPLLYTWTVHFNILVHLHIGLYSEYLLEWNKVFPANQTLVVRLEDFRDDRLSVLNDIYKHIGLEPLGDEYEHQLKSLGIINALNKAYVEPMRKETRQILDNFYKPFNKRLAHLLKDSKYLWNDM